ncbi:segregation/condensation protein A [Streptomyces sp. NPDC020917]|uniref:segregation and condensation protein A n=1 Tax=Streptomyces sp. NPDC020917 TaxID=3365102 RepID=UPI0037997BC6
MPTTPDDPAAPRRRLGRGGAAAPAPPAVAWDPAPEVEPAQVEQPEPEFAPEFAPEPEPVAVPAGGAGAPPEVDGAAEADVTVAVEPPPESVTEAVPEVTSDADAVPGVTPDAVSQEQPPASAAPDAEPATDAGGGGEAEAADGGNRFTVRLANFEGPFDLLLQLISKHKLDVTEVALSKVTNEFMAHIHAMGPDWDLDQTTEFLVVAATLLDLKAARLLPAAEVEDEGDLALLEARDLLFARLLQYRAYKQIAGIFAERLEIEALRYPRTVGLEPQHAELLPEVVLSIGPERFAQLAVKAMQPRPKPQVYVDHIHAPLVSVREQAEHVIALLRERGAASFGELTADAADTLTVVARFLALLELYREKAVALDQEEALGALQVRWTGSAQEGDQPLVTDEFDRETPADPDKRRPAGAAASAAPGEAGDAPGGADTSEPGPAAGEGESP